jgi:hypothetical protein
METPDNNSVTTEEDAKRKFEFEAQAEYEYHQQQQHTEAAGVDPADLQYDQNWLNASAKTHRYFTGKDWTEDDGDATALANYGLDRMRWINSNLPGLTVDTAKIAFMSEDERHAFGYLLENYDNVNTTLKGAATSALYMAADPLNWTGLFSAGIGTATAQATKVVSKTALKEILKFGLHSAYAGALTTGVSDALLQTDKMQTGVQDGFSAGELAVNAAAGGAVGGVLGAGITVAGTALRGLGKEAAPSLAGDAARAVGAPPEAPGAALATPGAIPARPGEAATVQAGTAATTPAAASTAFVPTLPKELAGAKPRYSFGGDSFDLQFKSDIEKALYITAQAKKSARDADYRAFLAKAGYSNADINAYGKQVRDAIKGHAKANPGAGVLSIDPVAPRKGAAPPVEGPRIPDAVKPGVPDEFHKNSVPVAGNDNALREGSVEAGDISDPLEQFRQQRGREPTSEEHAAFMRHVSDNETRDLLDDADIRAANPAEADRLFGKGTTPPEGGDIADRIIKSIKDYTANTGYRVFNRTHGTLSRATDEAANLLRAVTDNDVQRVVDKIAKAEMAGEQVDATKYAIMRTTQKMHEELAEMQRSKVELETAGQRGTQAYNDLVAKMSNATRVASIFKSQDKDMGSSTGASLATRVGMINTGANREIDVNSWLTKQGIDYKTATPEQYAKAQEQHWQWIEAVDRAVRAKPEMEDIERQMQVEYGRRDNSGKLAQLAQDRELKRQIIAAADPNPETHNAIQQFDNAMRYVTEWAIGEGAFSVKTIVVNVLPHVINSTIMPGVDFIARGANPTAYRQMVATYAAMYGQIGMSWKFAKAAFALERSMLTGFGDFTANKMLESDIAWKGTAGRFIRLFPRFVGGVDDFFSSMSYRGYIASEAAADAMLRADATGLNAADRSKLVKEALSKAADRAFDTPNAATVMQFLRKRGMQYGYRDDALNQWVTVQLNKHYDAIKTFGNDAGKFYADDMAYRRAFSGGGPKAGAIAGPLSMAAKGYESFVNKHPIMKIMGQLFFRTPVRVVEAAMRLTAGVNMITPHFIRDLRGLGPGWCQWLRTDQGTGRAYAVAHHRDHGPVQLGCRQHHVGWLGQLARQAYTVR